MKNQNLSAEELQVIENFRKEKEAKAIEAERAANKQKYDAIDSAKKDLADKANRITKNNDVLRTFYDKSQKLFKGQFILTTEKITLKQVPYYYDRVLKDKDGYSKKIELDEVTLVTDKIKVVYKPYNLELEVGESGSYYSSKRQVMLSGSLNNYKTTYYQAPETWVRRVNTLMEAIADAKAEANRKKSAAEKAVDFAKKMFPKLDVKADSKYHSYGYRRGGSNGYSVPVVTVGKKYKDRDYFEHSISYSYSIEKDQVILTGIEDMSIPSELSKKIQAAKNQMVMDYFKSL